MKFKYNTQDKKAYDTTLSELANKKILNFNIIYGRQKIL